MVTVGQNVFLITILYKFNLPLPQQKKSNGRFQQTRNIELVAAGINDQY